MSIITTALELANLALGKFGGAGDQISASGQLANLSGTDQVTTQVNTYLPICRQRAILDLASLGSPFRETAKKADLGDDLKANDIGIATLTGDGATMTVTTSEAHGRSTGNTVFLADLEGASDIVALNATLKTITVTSTTAFTFAGTATGTHTADSGIISDCPEIDPWEYAFNLPSDFLGLVGQKDTDDTLKKNMLLNHFPNDIILNRAGSGLILLTNSYSNKEGDSAYIEYVIDQTTYSLWTAGLVECATLLLAAELCPVVGRDSKESFFFRKQYLDVAVPNAARHNGLRTNLNTKTVGDFLGGRSELRMSKRSYYSINKIPL